MSPGGYESWRFDAFDPTQNLRISIGFHDGYVLHPDYVRWFNAYRRRPTRNKPPIPSEYPCLVVSARRGDETLVNSIIAFPPSSLQFVGSGLSLLSNRVEFCGGKRSIRVGQPIALEVNVAPTLPLTFERRIGVEVEHHWLCAPLCGVSGAMQIGSRKVTLEGYGQENHLYGSGPPTTTAKRWMRGQILFPRAAVNFLAADDETLVILSDESGVRQVDDSRMVANWDLHTAWSLWYPSSIDFGRWLTLRNPRILFATPGNLELTYDAYVDGQQTTAWIEIDYPDCLRGLIQAWVMKRKFITGK
jgi:hypothetical protein